MEKYLKSIDKSLKVIAAELQKLNGRPVPKDIRGRPPDGKKVSEKNDKKERR